MIAQRNLSLLANRLHREHGGRRIPEAVLERDYCLAWFLVGLSQSRLGQLLIFKGGTALKRCHFGDYRFSEDLDFTLARPAEFAEIREGLEIEAVMLPLRLVIDTNVLISAAIKPAGLQRTVLLLAITKPARLYVSRPILEEYSEVLARPELKIRKALRRQLLQLIKNHSYTVAPTHRLEVAGDPDDNMFVECADAARADYLVTGRAATAHLRQLLRKTSIGLTPEARLAGMYPETAATSSNASAIPR
jgi:putative PIN family toxin of toxin-antitoxin system